MLTNSQFRFLFILTFTALMGSPLRAGAVTAANAFRPPDPEELKMTSEPAAPGAPAIILYRQVDRDDNSKIGHESDYYRIKILTEEGRKYADVEIPFYQEEGKIIGIHARTVKPDGSIVNYEGKVFTKTVTKARGVKYLAKTFTLPDVQPGCVIEYFYTLDLEEDKIYGSYWILNEELFTKNAKFTLKPYIGEQYHVHWITQNLPPGASPPKPQPDKSVRLELSDIPAFQAEDYIPPENELKGRVDFIYDDVPSGITPTEYWNNWGKKHDGQLEAFVGKHKAIAEAVGQIVAPNDSPDAKLQKIYARVQSMRNTSFEVEKTEQEEQRAKEKAAANIEEVWKRGYGDGAELTWLFLGLARAAGFDAYGAMVPNRSRYFFYPNVMEGERLNSNVVLVKLNGKDLWFDPGWAFTPFGLLPWPETGVQALQLDKKGSAWVQSLTPTSADARTERHAELTLSDTGDLAGTIRVSYSGLESAKLRLEERNADETERKTYLENELKGYIPAACEVKLTNQPDWKSSDPPLVAEFDARIPGWASGAGRRALLPVGLFGAHEKHVFDHAERVNPIYFEYPFQDVDDITIGLPQAWKVSSLPPGKNDSRQSVTYILTANSDQGKVHITRKMAIELILIEPRYYAALRNYFQEIKTTDEQQVVLEPGAANASN